jgi:hypothetical protein
MRSALHVDAPEGERWAMSLDLLRSGDGLVVFRDRLLLYRDAAGPTASGRVVVEILASAPRESLTRARAASDIAEGLAVLRDIEDDLRPISSVHGLDRAYVEDLDTARVSLASVADDGSLEWGPDGEPLT